MQRENQRAVFQAGHTNAFQPRNCDSHTLSVQTKKAVKQTLYSYKELHSEGTMNEPQHLHEPRNPERERAEGREDEGILMTAPALF